MVVIIENVFVVEVKKTCLRLSENISVENFESSYKPPDFETIHG